MTGLKPRFWKLTAICVSLLVSGLFFAQVTPEDYERSNRLRQQFQGLAVGFPESANAIPNTSRFWYRKSVKGGNEFVLVDAETQAKKPAFDHEKLAVSLSTAAGARYSAVTLPFSTFRFVDSDR